MIAKRMKTKRQIFSIIFSLTVAVFGIACTQTPTKTEYDKSTDFSKLKTYVWGNNSLKMERTGQTVDRMVDDIARTVTDNVQKLVNTELAAIGFTLATKDKPDVVVQYSAKSTVGSLPSRDTYAPGGVTAPTAIDGAGMIIGTLTIYLLEPSSFKLLWRGETNTIIKFDGKTENRLERVIKKMFSDFPPK